MIPLDELRRENEELGQLCEALAVLIEGVSMRNPVVQELVDRFVGKVGAHMAHESRSLYGELLAHGDKHARHVAEQFLDSTHALNRIFSRYGKRWCEFCDKGEHAEQVRTDTKEVMRLVQARIALETERLFPLVAQSQSAA